MTNRRMFARQGIALISAITGIIAVSSSWAEETTPTLTEIIVTAPDQFLRFAAPKRGFVPAKGNLQQSLPAYPDTRSGGRLI